MGNINPYPMNEEDRAVHAAGRKFSLDRVMDDASC